MDVAAVAARAELHWVSDLLGSLSVEDHCASHACATFRRVPSKARPGFARALEPYLAAAVGLLIALLAYLLVRARREQWLPRIRKSRAAYLYRFPPSWA